MTSGPFVRVCMINSVHLMSCYERHNFNFFADDVAVFRHVDNIFQTDTAFDRARVKVTECICTGNFETRDYIIIIHTDFSSSHVARVRIIAKYWIAWPKIKKSPDVFLVRVLVIIYYGIVVPKKMTLLLSLIYLYVRGVSSRRYIVWLFHWKIHSVNTRLQNFGTLVLPVSELTYLWEVMDQL